MDCKNWIVIGAGPAGIAAAIALAKREFKVVVYDKVSTLEQNDEDSYPIGLNPRGMNVLDYLDESGQLREKVTKETPIDAWNIYRGAKQIIKFPSGTTVGATRGGVTYCIYNEAKSKYSDKITFNFCHKLTSVDFESKKLEFEYNNETIEIDASNSRIIAADGVWSKVRTQYESKIDKSFSTLTPWDCSFRLLFSENNPKTTLSPTEHHIFSNGIYVAVADSENQRWVIGVQISSQNPHQKVLESDQATPENISILKDYIKENAPQAFDLIPEQDFTQFFSRRTFSGSVVCASKLNIDEWIVFLGDSAHSVYPAAGEGVNCALEDVQEFDKCFSESLHNLFENFNSKRHEDIVALTTYATYLVHGSNTSKRSEKIARVVSAISLQVGQKVGIFGPIWNDKSFGTSAEIVEPYHVLLDSWKRQSRFVEPFSYAVGVTVDTVMEVGSYLWPIKS